MCGPWSGATNPTQGNPVFLVQEQRPTVLPDRHVLPAKLFLLAEVGSTCVAGIFFFFFFPSHTRVAFSFPF